MMLFAPRTERRASLSSSSDCVFAIHPHLSLMKAFQSKAESATKSVRAAYVRVVLRWTRAMIGFCALLGATLCGLAGMAPWPIAIATLALAAASRSKYDELYLHAERSGLSALTSSTTLKSISNAAIASTAAFGGGLLLRLLS